MHLLQTEDKRGNVILVREVLKDVDTRVELSVVEDEQAALDFLGRCTTATLIPCPDVMLLDFTLPRKNGNELLQELKQHSRFKSIPMGVFTGSEEPQEVHHCYELDANAFLRKPIDVDEYFAIVRSCVEFWGACQVP